MTEERDRRETDLTYPAFGVGVDPFVGRVG